MAVLDKFSLGGRTALVTAGAGPLFGSSISEALAEAGATVITASRSLAANEEFAARLRSAGYDARGMELDITDVASILRLRERVIGEFGRLDVLVNSALARVGGGFETQTPEDWLYSARGDMVGLFAIFSSAPRLLVESFGFSPITLGLLFAAVVFVVFAAGMLCTAHKTPEFASHVIIMTLGMYSLSDCQPAPRFHVARIGCQ